MSKYRIIISENGNSTKFHEYDSKELAERKLKSLGFSYFPKETTECLGNSNNLEVKFTVNIANEPQASTHDNLMSICL